MKKTIFSLLIYLFLVPCVYAGGKVNFLDINVQIDSEGNAHFVENWGMPKQETRSFKKDFLFDIDTEIKDIVIKNEKESNLKEVDTLEQLKEGHFFVSKKDTLTEIHFMTKGEEAAYSLEYTIPHFIMQFKDVQGIYWQFIPLSGEHTYNHVSVTIASEIPFTETNTALYAIGKNITASFGDGKLYVSSNEISPISNVVLMTRFTENFYTSVRKSEESFQEIYDKTLVENHVMDKILSFIKEEIVYLLLGLTILLVIGWFIIHFFGKNKNERQKKLEFSDMEDVPCYDSVPCGGDLYVLNDFTERAGLLKSKVHLIDAILLKWLFEQRVTIVKMENTSTLHFKENQIFSNFLDSDLYEYFLSSSSKHGLDKMKLSKYCKINEKDFYYWFKNTRQVVVEEAKKQGKIKEVKKWGKTEDVLQEEYLQEIERIKGVKKYLLYFNQVPRQTELTVDKYKELLIMAELLGIGGQVSKEILRKNPKNVLAHLLQEFESVKPIYEDLYDDVLKYHKESKKKAKKRIDMPKKK